MIYYLIITLALIIGLSYIGNLITRHTASQSTKLVINWFIILAIMNIIITMFIFASYDTLKIKRGPIGPKGKRGVSGSTGKNASCMKCAPAISGLKPIRPLNKPDVISPMDPTDERKKLFSRKGHVTERYRVIQNYLLGIYKKIHKFVLQEGVNNGFNYNTRKSYADQYGNGITNEFHKYRKILTLEKVKNIHHTIDHRLNVLKPHIKSHINLMHYHGHNLDQNHLNHLSQELIKK